MESGRTGIRRYGNMGLCAALPFGGEEPLGDVTNSLRVLLTGSPSFRDAFARSLGPEDAETRSRRVVCVVVRRHARDVFVLSPHL